MNDDAPVNDQDFPITPGSPPSQGFHVHTAQPPAVPPPQLILQAFEEFMGRFESVTRRAAVRFEQRDWLGGHQDALERIDLYPRVLAPLVEQLRIALGPALHDRSVWAEIKAATSQAIAERSDFELAETFFNSVTRRIFTTVGVDPAIEFVDSDFELPTEGEPDGLLRVPLHKVGGQLPVPLSAQALAQIERSLLAQGVDPAQAQVELLPNVFYRSTGAFRIGRIRAGERFLPLVFCLTHPAQGMRLDAVLLDENDVSILFSFTRSAFHVSVAHTARLIAFLRSIMPHKRVAELYIAIGFHKHGKTELYRDLLAHLAHSSERFCTAPGERGMVMLVFTLAGYDLVFKIIKDQADPPKATSRAEVMERYDLVFRHDRAGRLVDAQEFEHLRFERERFQPELLAELLSSASQTVSLDGECVVIRHVYVERRLTPLNLYVQQAPPEAAERAVLDYGQAIKDLAATNIFPGDVLLKNFGVTRHGRVVFYDYDELCLLTECRFRRIPAASTFEDDFAAEPWFYVGPADIFPAEFETFLGLQGALRDIFRAAHADLFGVEYWRGVQKRLKAGEVIEIRPYAEAKRLEG